jgi:hypothetical protein
LIGLKAWLEPDEIFSDETKEVYHDGHEFHGHTYAMHPRKLCDRINMLFAKRTLFQCIVEP